MNGRVMGREKRPGKRPRVEDDGGGGVQGRTGVAWRSPWVVEMRLPKEIADLKLHFGSYDSEIVAMVARDYGAFLRDSTGKEDRGTVGGFRNPRNHPIFEFENSRAIFESSKFSAARCEEYKSLLEVKTKEASKKFCEAARKDIRDAIPLFRSRYPQRFVDSRQLNRLPNAGLVDDGEIHRTPPPPSSDVRVSPTPGCVEGANMGEGSTSFIGASSLEVQVAVNSSPFQTLLFVKVPGLTTEEILKITKAWTDGIQRNLVDKLLEELEPCTIDAETIPYLE